MLENIQTDDGLNGVLDRLKIFRILSIELLNLHGGTVLEAFF